MNNELKHYGVLGMRWGVRKGKKQRSLSDDYVRSRNIKKKHPSEMSNKELQDLNNRIQLERNYKNLNKRQKTAGEKFVTGIIVGAATTTATLYATKYAKKGAAALETLIKNAVKK